VEQQELLGQALDSEHVERALAQQHLPGRAHLTSALAVRLDELGSQVLHGLCRLGMC
jgi:hypothetical protein